MGAILAGIIQGLGQHAAEQNSIKNFAQDKANQEMAQAFDKMAQEEGRSPEDQFRLHQMAYTARTKGAKAIPAAQLQYWQQQIAQGTQQAKQAAAAQAQQQSQRNQVAQQQVAQGTGLAPPDNMQGTAGRMSQGPQVPTGLAGLAPPNPTNAAGAPSPAADASSAPSSAAAVLQPQAGSPPPVSGLPSPGFNTVGGTNTPSDNGAWVVPPKRGRFRSPIVDTGGAPLSLRSPEEMQEFSARGAGLTAGATAEAQRKSELEMQKALTKFRIEENEALMNRMRKEAGGAGHVYAEMGPNGASIKIDPGALSARPVAGKDLLESNPGMTDKLGRPIDPLKFYDYRAFPRAGGEEVMPTSVPPIVRVETPDPAHPEARFIVARDRLGQEIYREPYAPNAAFAPLVRSSTAERTVNLGDRVITAPFTTQNVTQRLGPGQPPAPSLPAPNSPANAAPLAPTGTPTTGVPAVPVAPRGGRSWTKSLSPSQVLPMKNSIEVASHQLWGDPDNPSLRPLSSYANLADDPAARQRLGRALRLVLDAGGDSGAEHLGASAGPVSFSAGNLGTTLSYKLGIPQAAADEKAKALRQVFEKMTPEEVDYFNSLMNAIPTVTGFRKLTSGGAFRWSQQGLERELPMIGLSGVNNSANFKQKMRNLGDEPLTAIKNLERTNPGVVDPRLALLIQGQNSVVPPGMTPPAAARPTNAEEYLRSIGR